MTSPYKKSTRTSLIIHGCIAILILSSGLFKGCACAHHKEEIKEVPITFTVAIPEEYVQPEAANPVEPEPDPIPEPARDPKPDPKPVEKEPLPTPKKDPPKKDPIVKSTKIIQKKPEIKPRTIIPVPPNTKTVKNTDTKLTPEEIRKLLDLGATPGESTIIPAERDRCLLAIKNALYAAWIKPGSEHKTGRPTVAEISLGSSGAVLNCRITQSSGNPVLDDSVRAALAAVPRFTNLTADFIKAHSTVTINFELE